MLIISSREFRANQKKYLDLCQTIGQILIRQGKTAAFSLRPVKEDDVCMSKEEFFAMIDASKAQYERGEYTELTPELHKELFGL